jgi:hypothetical protein
MRVLVRAFLIALGVTSGGLVIASSVAAQSIFFADNFENGWGLWTQSPANTYLPLSSLVNDSSNFPGSPPGNWSSQTQYRAGTIDAGGTAVLNLNRSLLPLHFKTEYDFKLSPGFKFPLGQKMWRTLPNMSIGQLANDPDINVQLNNYGTQWSIEAYSNSQPFGNREFVLRRGISIPTTGTWHRLGIRVKSNTFSGSTPNFDGELEIFYEGVSLGVLTGVRINADPTRWVRDYWGGPGNYTSVVDNNPLTADQWIRIDNFQLTDLGGVSIPPPTSLSVR